MLRNLATSLILTEREDDFYEGLFQSDGKTPVSPPKYKGRVVTTLHKAKEVRSLVEKCVTIARKAIKHDDEAAKYETEAEKNTPEWESWRQSDQWRQWVDARAPGVAARRRVFDILRDKEAVSILFEDIAPRFEDRPGGYTRILKIAKPRLGDAGAQAILEFVGRNDRATQVSEKPEFDTDDEVENDSSAVADGADGAGDDAEVDQEQAPGDPDSAADAAADATEDENSNDDSSGEAQSEQSENDSAEEEDKKE